MVAVLEENAMVTTPAMQDTDWLKASAGFKRYLQTTGRSANTIRSYTSNVSIFWRWFRPDSLIEAKRSDVRAWVAHRTETVSGARAHNDIAALRLFYLWLIEDQYRDDDPTEGVKVKRGKSLPTEPLKQHELSALLTACESERDRLMVLVLAATGMRISELASLEAEDIDWLKGEIRVTGKGNKERRIAPRQDVLNRLRAYLGMFASGPLFLAQNSQRPLSGQQIRKIIYKIADSAKIEHVHPHRFRAYFATQYVGQFADIQALQSVLGHESIETTALYSQSTQEQRGLEQMRRLGLPEGEVA